MDRKSLSNRLFFLITFLILLVLAYFILEPFINIIIVALISIIVLKPLYSRILNLSWIKGRSRLSASITLLLVFMLILIPVYILGRVFLTQLSTAMASIDASSIEALNFSDQIETLLLEAQQAAEANTTSALDAIVNIGVSLLEVFITVLIFVIIFITLMPEFDNTVKRIEDISPMGKEISELYHTKTAAMVSSIFRSFFIIAFLEGLIMGFFYWLADMNLWFLLMIISMVLAILPLVGISWLVIILSAVLLLQGNTTSAIIILVGFYGVANWVDVLLRPKLVSKDANLNFTLFLLGILGGVAWAGFLGLFYGPVVMLLLVTTVRIYSERFSKEDSDVIQDYLS